MSRFEVVVELHAVVTVDAVDENSARIAAWKNIEDKLPLAAMALGAELKLDDVACSEPVPEASRNEADDAEPFYRPPRSRGRPKQERPPTRFAAAKRA